MHRTSVIVLALLAVIAGPALAEEISDPTGSVCVNPGGDAACTDVAVAGTGNATCEEFTCVAASGTGNASSCFADDQVTDIDCIAASGTGDATGDNLAVAGTGNATADRIALSGTGNAASQGSAVSGTGNASGPTALSGTGTATGEIAIHRGTLAHALESTGELHTDELSGDATGWPPLHEASVRPGVRVLGGSCTAGFIFSDPANETLYVSTAGHCLDDESLGEKVSLAGGRAWGFVAYKGLQAVDGVDEGRCASWIAQDFGLIEIPSGLRDEVHPATLFWGGPTDSRRRAHSGEEIHTYGNSTDRSHEGLRPATGRALGNHPCTTTAALPQRIGGDSGSPVLGSDGGALGLHSTTHLLVGHVEFPNVHQSARFAENHTSLELELKTWPEFREAPVDGAGVTSAEALDPPTHPGS